MSQYVKNLESTWNQSQIYRARYNEMEMTDSENKV